MSRHSRRLAYSAFSYVGLCQDALISHGLGSELGSRPPREAQALTQPEWSGVAGGAVRVGSGLGRVPGYHVQLLAGSTLLSEGTSLNPNDGFLSSAVSYIALAGNSLIGQHLKIVLISNGSQVNFDNVRLDATSLDLAPTPVSNPEPATLIMWGMGILGLAGWARGRGPTLD